MENTTTEAPAKEEIKLSLPRVDGPVMEFNPETSMFWIGIPVNKVPVLEATLLLDSMKIEYFKAVMTLIKAEQERKSKIVTPQEHSSMMKNFVNKFKK